MLHSLRTVFIACLQMLTKLINFTMVSPAVHADPIPTETFTSGQSRPNISYNAVLDYYYWCNSSFWTRKWSHDIAYFSCSGDALQNKPKALSFQIGSAWLFFKQMGNLGIDWGVGFLIWCDTFKMAVTMGGRQTLRPTAARCCARCPLARRARVTSLVRYRYICATSAVAAVCIANKCDLTVSLFFSFCSVGPTSLQSEILPLE